MEQSEAQQIEPAIGWRRERGAGPARFAWRSAWAGRLCSMLCGLLCLFAAATASVSNAAAPDDDAAGHQPFIPDKLADDLQRGNSREVLVLFDDTDVRRQAAAEETIPGARLAQRTGRYRALKQDVLAELPAQDATLLRDYSRLPMSFIKIHAAAGLDWLRSRPGIVAIYENKPIYTNLGESLPLIHQPETAEASLAGAGVGVAIIDTGVLYTHAAFGSCTSPGVPENCKVAASIEIASNDGQLDPQGHGTNVSAIVAGVAPAADLVVLDIFEGNSSSSALLIGAINWLLDNHSTYNIRAVNLSLGDGSLFTKPCSKSFNNPFLLPINDLREIGITVVASSGNNGYTNGVSMPACTPGVISVGAVYDANVGARTWSACSDAASAADQVTCFSNSADFLSILAPGALITAGGYVASGTSQAGPHVAGAAAVLAAAQPLFSPNDIASRLTSTGVAVTDSRNGIARPRLDLAAALAPEMEARSTSSGDVPFLPVWALFAMGTSVVLIGLRKQRGP